MAEFKWIELSLIAMLALQFTAAAGQLRLFPIVRDGDAATLSCENVIEGQSNCDSTTWLLIRSGSNKAIELINLGQIGEEAKNISDRLTVTPNCSLAMKKVTAEDAARYICQQFISNKKQGSDAKVFLSVITMTEYKSTDEVKLTCSVSPYEDCTHKVRWLYVSTDDENDVKTSCSASLTLKMNSPIYETRFKFLKCGVTITSRKEQLFAFNLQPSGEGTIATTTQGGSNATGITTTPVINDALTTQKDDFTTDKKLQPKYPRWWWLYIIAAVVVVALLIIVAKVVKMKRTKGNKKWTNDEVGLRSDSAVTQSTGQDMAAPEDGISYATISYTRTTNSNGQLRRKKDEEDNTVTYTTVKVSPTTDPSNLYATVNKPKNPNSC